MFNVIKVDLKDTQLKPFVYPPDATAEYTIADEGCASKWRFPKEVAEAVASGCSLGFVTGYDVGREEFAKSSQLAWYAAYALLMLDEKDGAEKLKNIVREKLLEQGQDLSLIDNQAKVKNEGPKVNRQIPNTEEK